ncbi:hypothetical protein IX38_04400 [Chryseobacterium luteum]|uniref:Uncharacterized protein n=1 Tax=Chryseobacterium luteum TaxID=421531 RepID=A0A085ZW74_9FLAO|nr:hypothetical protein IX38_04400 [Chryseobacterium luteum]
MTEMEISSVPKILLKIIINQQMFVSTRMEYLPKAALFQWLTKLVLNLIMKNRCEEEMKR